MKVHYINILLFALPLNILEHNPWNHYMKPHTYTNRSLCECDLYIPNYDNDAQMKEVMENFIKQTQQRFHDYDDRMKEKRKQCKERCDKEIEKIILKDKIEKELSEKLNALQTNIKTEDIPTCICEKSLVDKVEKGCLRCGGLLGGGIAPGWGLVSGLGYVGWTNYITEIAIQKGIEEGVKYGIQCLTDFPGLYRLIKVSQIQSFINPANYAEKTTYFSFLQDANKTYCSARPTSNEIFCHFVSYRGESALSQRASEIAENAVVTAEVAKEGVLEEGASATSSLTTGITASIIAIVVIVLVMIIIYLVLRYRRKKKMKKKLEYIKLLKE
ncbi:hypothetical protein PFHG_04343 [Plasmodium falciparum HB3]|uniref:Rifin n=1 Tax=Plasmodium falciparum (isolate HB3) TaxID=137071 RepID=A0A0L7KI98_PLAFX|nr:hypothetical protein PFHG_04343 [Plasmodium falciparum HB3]